MAQPFVEYPLTPELAQRACDLAIQGVALADIAKECFVSEPVFTLWRRKYPLFSRHLELAREVGMDTLVEKMPAIALDPDVTSHRARIWVDAIKFRAERKYRKTYGQNIDVQLTERVDIGGALIEARKRAMLPQCDLGALPNPHDTEYTMIVQRVASDTESLVPVNPFD